MTRGRATGLEQAIDGFAATAFALCAAWTISLWDGTPIVASAGAVFAGLSALGCLRIVGNHAAAPGFGLVEPAFDDVVDDTLLLEDRLAEPADDSQVVRLFAVGGGAAPHVPGELAARIDNFLVGNLPALRAVPAQPDATQELYEALADIRRTLR